MKSEGGGITDESISLFANGSVFAVGRLGSGTGVALPEADSGGAGVGSGGMCEGRSGSLMSGVVEEEVCEDCEVEFSVSPNEPPLSASTVRMLLQASGWGEASGPPCLILRTPDSGSSLEKPLSS